MKPFYKLIPVLLLSVCFFEQSFSQKLDNKFKTNKLFSLRQAKFQFGIGIEASPNFAFIKASSPRSMHSNYKDPTSTDSMTIPYASVGISFDFFSAHSLLGLTFGANYAMQDFVVANKPQQLHDFFRTKKIEVPVYIRIRPGKRISADRLWLLLGGAYNIPVGGDRTRYEQGFGGYMSHKFTDDSKEQFQSYFTVSTQIGAEIFSISKNAGRFVLYASAEYPLGNAVNTNYHNFKYLIGDGVLSDYDNVQIRQVRIGAGLKVFFGSSDKKN